MTSLQDGVEMWGECAGLVCEGWGHVGSMVLFVQVASGRAVSRDQFPSPPPLPMGSEGDGERPTTPLLHLESKPPSNRAWTIKADLPAQKECGASVEGDLNDLPLKIKMSLQVGYRLLICLYFVMGSVSDVILRHRAGQWVAWRALDLLVSSVQASPRDEQPRPRAPYMSCRHLELWLSTSDLMAGSQLTWFLVNCLVPGLGLSPGVASFSLVI
ncbi:uncharacterized protein LOC117069714 [Trachypithecus francoisi]|uniref:uncharacterized protein LOC117069714 n=1 Tax=Trachypithecus francoisi TaxID=54180 RepID=UPI00141AA42E|nr:uncharacterized protein LOC117069714 [Trachypithecus francoisi]